MNEATIEVRINGEPTAVPRDATVAEVLQRSGVTTGRVAVELNGDVLPRALLHQRTLAPGDTIEIVRLVGGG